MTIFALRSLRPDAVAAPVITAAEVTRGSARRKSGSQRRRRADQGCAGGGPGNSRARCAGARSRDDSRGARDARRRPRANDKSGEHSQRRRNEGASREPRRAPATSKMEEAMEDSLTHMVQQQQQQQQHQPPQMPSPPPLQPHQSQHHHRIPQPAEQTGYSVGDIGGAGGFGGAQAVSANVFASGHNQNCGNVMTGRSTTRVAQAPGGTSSLRFY